MSGSSATDGFKKFGWMFNLVGAWIGLCIAMHFIYSPDQQYNDIVKHCGNSSAFCACQAQAIVDQRSFLVQPLFLVGLKTYRNVAPMCAQYK
ncbi:hypothetical protein KYK29_15615 [Shinella daejeonensis]|uniref:hypothetical protein n=1 Tax=Shinella daejeonensis TaxID=659017 RepID=UPI0020C754E5|nr:hypothetical protein [Shinella daejeonensis]MCP8896355.1 hypothetical protein [Shinella daejeonensis]